MVASLTLGLGQLGQVAQRLQGFARQLTQQRPVSAQTGFIAPSLQGSVERGGRRPEQIATVQVVARQHRQSGRHRRGHVVADTPPRLRRRHRPHDRSHGVDEVEDRQQLVVDGEAGVPQQALDDAICEGRPARA